MGLPDISVRIVARVFHGGGPLQDTSRSATPIPPDRKQIGLISIIQPLRVIAKPQLNP